MRKLLLLLIFCLMLFGISSELAIAQEIQNDTQSEQIFSRQKTDIIVNAVKKLLKNNNWYVKAEDREIFAYKFGHRFDELRIIIDYKYDKEVHVFKITVITDKVHIKEIKIENGLAYDNLYIRDKILSYVSARINSDYNSNTNRKKIYFTSLSAGYNRTHDNYRFYPEYGQGSFYVSGNLTYDPAANIMLSSIPLTAADYFSSDFYFAFDSKIRENFFNIDLLIYGNNKYESMPGKTKRSLYGLFNGFEYFRPGFNDSDVQWNLQIYKKQPHIQYTLWRAVQGAVINTYESNNRIIKNFFSAGIGPGINSSLTATDVSVQEEDELSHIFKSMKYRKQNYYYSIFTAISAGLIVDKIYDFKLEAGYNFYFFYPIENEKAFDMLNIIKFSIGYYLTQNSLLAANYEYWNIESMVKDIEKDHSWNRLIMEIKYFF